MYYYLKLSTEFQCNFKQFTERVSTSICYSNNARAMFLLKYRLLVQNLKQNEM